MVLVTFDYVLIILYFCVLLYLGYRAHKGETKEGFLIADRKLNAFRTMATVNASKTGSILIIFTAMVYLWGFSAIWYFIGMVVGMFVFLPFALRMRKKAGKAYTLADYFKKRSASVATLASLCTIIIMTGFFILNLIGGTLVFVFFTGFPFWICALIVMSIVVVYLLLGGFKAVAKTDVLQYVAILAILGCMVLLLFNGRIIPSSEWGLFNTDAASFVGFFLLGTLFPFGSPDLWQRVYAARNAHALKWGIISSACVYAVFAILLGLLALTIKVTFPDIDHNLALIHGFAHLLPVGLVGLAVVLLFSAIMSSLDTYLYTASSAIVQDFMQTSIAKIKWVMVILSVVAFGITILIKDIGIGSYMFVPFMLVISVCVLATWIRSRISNHALLGGFGLGMLATLCYIIVTLSSAGLLQPIVIIYAIVFTLLGLLIGGIVHRFRN